MRGVLQLSPTNMKLARDILHEDKEVLVEPCQILPKKRGLGDAAGVDDGAGTPWLLPNLEWRKLDVIMSASLESL